MGDGNGWTDGLCLENGNECNELDYVFRLLCSWDFTFFCCVMMEMEKETHLLFFLVSFLVKENNSLSLSQSNIKSAPLDTYAASHSILLSALDGSFFKLFAFRHRSCHSCILFYSTSQLGILHALEMDPPTRLGFIEAGTFTVRGK